MISQDRSVSNSVHPNSWIGFRIDRIDYGSDIQILSTSAEAPSRPKHRPPLGGPLRLEGGTGELGATASVAVPVLPSPVKPLWSTRLPEKPCLFMLVPEDFACWFGVRKSKCFQTDTALSKR